VTQLFLYNVIGFIEVALTVLIIARIAVSWIGLSPWHPVVRWLRVIVDPILAPFRRILPTFSGLDFSPILALVVINIVAQLLQTLVLGGGINAGQTVALLIEQVVVDVAIAIAVLVFIRVLLAVFHADPWHPLVQMIRSVTKPLVAPFAGLHRRGTTPAVDLPAIAALVMYIVVIIAIKFVFGLIFP
jgi:YggT family protein